MPKIPSPSPEARFTDFCFWRFFYCFCAYPLFCRPPPSNPESPSLLWVSSPPPPPFVFFGLSTLLFSLRSSPRPFAYDKHRPFCGSADQFRHPLSPNFPPGLSHFSGFSPCPFFSFYLRSRRPLVSLNSSFSPFNNGTSLVCQFPKSPFVPNLFFHGVGSVGPTPSTPSAPSPSPGSVCSINLFFLHPSEPRCFFR